MYDPEALGQRLRDARQAKDLTVEDIERAIRIRARFVDALERGDYTPMTPVQAQGFLRNYARFLGLDFDLLVAELDAEGKGRGRRRRMPEPPAHLETPPPSAAARPVARPGPQSAARPPKARARRGALANNAIVLVAGAIVVALVLGVTQLIDSLATSKENAPVTQLLPTQTSAPTGTLLGTLAPGETPVASPAASYVPPTLTGNSVVVTIQMAQRTWLRVTVDGVIEQEGLARPGDVWRFEGQQSVGVRASNAAALQLTVNNQPQGTLGGRGELFEQTFSLSGAVSLVPTAAATATLVLEPGEMTPVLVPAAATTSPEPAAATPSITPWPTLSDGAPTAMTPEQIPAQAATLAPTTAAPATVAPADTAVIPATAVPTFTAAVPTTAAPPTLTPTPSPPPTNTFARTPSPTPSLSPTRTPTPTFTPSLTPSLTLTPTPSLTIAPTPTFTPSVTPFLPPRITRTPSPPPK